MKYKIAALLNDRPEEIDWTPLDSSPAALWVEQYYDTYGSLPTLELFAQECLDEGEQPVVMAPWSYYVKEAQDLKFVQDAGKYLEAFNSAYANDPKTAILALRDNFSKLTEPDKSAEPTDIAAETEERWKKFTLKQGARIKTGIQPFDEASGGISPDDEFMILSARLGVGKALKYGTRVLGADGIYRPVEDFKVGDYLVGCDGKPTQIVKVRDFEKLNLYRVEFIDHTYIDCCEDHLWTLRKGQKYYTVDTKTLASSRLGDIGAGTGKSQNKGVNYWRWYLPKIVPPEFTKKEYLIKPYTLGVLLGDGGFTTHSLNFTSFDKEIVEGVAAELPSCLVVHSLKGEGGYSICRQQKGRKGQVPIKNEFVMELERLGLMGKHSWEKHIPEEYLNGSIEQRLDLLAGLIDTDGYVSPGGSGLDLSLTSEALIDDARYLVESLGGYARKRVAPVNWYTNARGEKIYTRPVYSLTIQLPQELPLKGPKRLRYRKYKIERTRPIISVTPIEPAGGRCFVVDNEDHLFLTEHFIPTHNSFLAHYIALEMAKQGINVGIYSGEMSEVEVGARIDTWLTHVSNFELTRGKYTDSSEQVKAYEEQVKGKLLVLTPKHLGHNATPKDIRKFCKDYNLSVVVIDQLSLMMPDGRQSSEMFQQFANLSLQLKSLQQELRIPIIAVSQLNRAAQEQEINASNISGSDRIGQDATIVLALERKEQELSIKVLKARSFKRPDKGWNFRWDVDKGILTPTLTALDSIKAQAEAAKAADKLEASQQQSEAAITIDEEEPYEEEDFG